MKSHPISWTRPSTYIIVNDDNKICFMDNVSNKDNNETMKEMPIMWIEHPDQAKSLQILSCRILDIIFPLKNNPDWARHEHVPHMRELVASRKKDGQIHRHALPVIESFRLHLEEHQRGF